MTKLSMIKVMLLSFLVISTGADEDLIKKECSSTDYQSTCFRCLVSDTTSYHTDRVGFAQIIVHCLESQLNILTNNVTSLLSRKGEGEAIKKVLEDCKKGFSITKLQLHEAKFSLVLRSYDKALGLVKTAFSYPLTCRDGLLKIKFKKSLKFYDEIGFYGQLSSVAKTMIQRLEYFI